MKHFVYRLYKDQEIIYIGSTTDMVKRLKAHTKEKDFNRADYCVLQNKNEMLNFESLCINKIRPKLNKTCPDFLPVNWESDVKWVEVEMSFLFPDKVDTECTFDMNVLSNYTEIVSDVLGVDFVVLDSLITIQDRGVRFKIKDGEIVLKLDGNGDKISKLSRSLGCISYKEFSEKEYRSAGLIPLKIYEESLAQFN